MTGTGPLLGMLGAGLGLILAGRLSWRRGRWLLASTGAASGTVLILGALGLALILLNLQTYHRLTQESRAAEISMERLGPQRYRVVLEQPGRMQMFIVEGDGWQLDARFLKWHGLATVLGFEPAYRLERFSGRYNDLDKERNEQRSVYGLAPDGGIDLWQLAHEYGRWVPWVDAVYGSATYMPLTDGARYTVAVSPSGLLTRPANPVAEQAVAAWR